jgi:hypothetical protein
MRLLHVAVALLVTAPAAFASHPVEDDPLGFEDPEGPLLAQTCDEILFRDNTVLPEVPLSPVCRMTNLLVEVATDGYVLVINRLDATRFTLAVHHALFLLPGQPTLQLGLTPVALAPREATCAVAADCGGAGLFVHGPFDDGNALTGSFPPQRITTAPDGRSWTIEVTGAPNHPVHVTALGEVELANGDRVRGFYNPQKLAFPVDALDAVPYPTLL